MEPRIIDLEIKFTHQEELLNELNQVVTKQQFVIDKLTKEMLELKINSLHSEGEISNEKPPHY